MTAPLRRERALLCVSWAYVWDFHAADLEPPGRVVPPMGAQQWPPAPDGDHLRQRQRPRPHAVGMWSLACK